MKNMGRGEELSICKECKRHMGRGGGNGEDKHKRRKEEELE